MRLPRAHMLMGDPVFSIRLAKLYQSNACAMALSDRRPRWSRCTRLIIYMRSRAIERALVASVGNSVAVKQSRAELMRFRAAAEISGDSIYITDRTRCVSST